MFIEKQSDDNYGLNASVPNLQPAQSALFIDST